MNQRFEDAQVTHAAPAVPRLYRKYGDGIFPVLSCLLSRHRGHILDGRETLENSGMSSVREPVEWLYGDISSKFPFFDFAKNKKLRQSPVGETYFVCMLLNNCYITMNKCNAPDNFDNGDLYVPTLEEYMG